jgi:tetratricopeptide (TPR) repeat protein
MRSARLMLVAVLAIVPAFARAEEPAEAAARVDLARRHFQSGSAYFEEGRFAEAAREFRESYKLAPRMDLLFNIAQCYLRKGDAARAVAFYRRYLEANPVARDRPAIEHTVAGLARQIGTVRVTGAPDGADVVVDGEVAGRAPLAAPVEVTVGTVRVEALPADGGPSRVIEVKVRAGVETEARVPEPQVLVREKVVVKEKVVERLVEKPAAPRSRLATLTWAAAGTTAGLVLLGGALLAGSAAAVGVERNASNEAAWRSARDLAERLHTAGISVLAVGGAVAVVSTVGLLVGWKRLRVERAGHASLWLLPDGVGLAAGGTF